MDTNRMKPSGAPQGQRRKPSSGRNQPTAQRSRPPHSGNTVRRHPSPQEAKRAEIRRRSAQRTQARQKQKSRRRRAPAVVYTQPRPFQLNRLLLRLAIVMAVVLAITLGLSVFFKVGTVKVYGNRIYSPWVIQEASGIKNGDNLLGINNPRACGKIDAALPYIKSVRIGINLPDTVNIYIEEHNVVYAIQSVQNVWWLMTSDGTLVEQTDGGTAGNYTKILGVKLDTPEVGAQALAYEEPVTTDSPDSAQATETPVLAAPVVVTARERLQASLTILRALEQNDIVGLAASVDVSNLSAIELWYGRRYQVKLGDIGNVEYKIACMKDAISQMNEYQMGNLDVSFTSKPDQVIYTPFE